MIQLLLISFFTFFLSPQFTYEAYAQTHNGICIDLGNDSCSQISNKEWFFDDDVSINIPNRGTHTYSVKGRYIYSDVELNTSNDLKDLIMTNFAVYGPALAYGMASVSQKFDEIKYKNKEIDDVLKDVKWRVKDVQKKDKEIILSYQNAIPDLHKKLKGMRDDISFELKEIEQKLHDATSQIEDQITRNSVPEEDESHLLNVSLERLEFHARDKLLSDRRDLLLKNSEAKLPQRAIQNIYDVSGKIQIESQSLYAQGNYEGASFGQDIAMQLVDFGLGFIPIVGDGIALYEAVVGENPITGDALSLTERIISGVSGVVGLGSFGTLGGLVRGITKGADVFNISGATSRVFNKTKDLLHNAHQVGLKNKGDARELIELQHRVMGKELASSSEHLITSQVTKHSPINPGELHKPNKDGIIVANTFRSGTYFKHILEEPLTLYRVYSKKLDPNIIIDPLGSYWSRVKSTGPLQATIDVALLREFGNNAKMMAQITLPKGTKIFEGLAAPQKGIKGPGDLLGGGSQVYISLNDLKLIGRENLNLITKEF